jgi:hypothetical protein
MRVRLAAPPGKRSALESQWGAAGGKCTAGLCGAAGRARMQGAAADRRGRQHVGRARAAAGRRRAALRRRGRLARHAVGPRSACCLQSNNHPFARHTTQRGCLARHAVGARSRLLSKSQVMAPSARTLWTSSGQAMPAGAAASAKKKVVTIRGRGLPSSTVLHAHAGRCRPSGRCRAAC